VSALAFVRRAGTYGIGAGMLGVLRVALIPVFTRLLSVAEYGIYTTLYSVIGLLTVLCTLGLDEATSREYYDHRGGASTLRAFVRTALLIATGSASIVVAVGGALLLSGALQPTTAALVRRYGVILLVICLLTAAMGIFNVLLVARQKALLYVTTQNGRLIAMVAITLWLVIRYDLGVASVLWGEALSLVALVGVLWGEFHSHHQAETGAHRLASRAKVTTTMRYALPFLLYSLTNWTVSASDRLVLAKYCTLEALGQYGLGYTLAAGMNTVVLSGINMAYAPLFLRRAKEKEGHERAYARDLEVYVWAVGSVTLAAILLSPEVVRVIAPARYGGAVPTMQVVVFAFLLQGLFLMYSLPLVLHRRSSVMASASALAAVTNVGLNLVLVPRFGTAAAAWTTVLGYLVMATYAAYYAVRAYPSHVRHLAVILPVAGVAAIGIVARSWGLGARLTVLCLAILAGVRAAWTVLSRSQRAAASASA
jgi:O-antigen/teichoic acid export membrane protein